MAARCFTHCRHNFEHLLMVRIKPQMLHTDVIICRFLEGFVCVLWVSVLVLKLETLSLSFQFQWYWAPPCGDMWSRPVASTFPTHFCCMWVTLKNDLLPGAMVLTLVYVVLASVANEWINKHVCRDKNCCCRCHSLQDGSLSNSHCHISCKPMEETRRSVTGIDFPPYLHFNRRLLWLKAEVGGSAMTHHRDTSPT